MSESRPNRSIFISVLFGALLALSAWQQHQIQTLESDLAESVSKQSEELEKIRVVLAPFETMKNPDLLPIQSGKTRSEVQGPRGPMPVSILTKADPLPGEPPPGTDITSTIKRSPVDPCKAACQRLSNCALEPDLCPEMDTRKHDRVFELCMDSCSSNSKIQRQLAGVTECAQGIDKARKSVSQFSSLCGERR